MIAIQLNSNPKSHSIQFKVHQKAVPLNSTQTHSNQYIDYIDDQLFIYHGLRRKDYDLFRDQQREGKFEFRGAEEEICRLGIEYPMKKDFDPSSKTFVYGMASLLSILVMKASGFNKQVSVKKL